MPRTYGTTNAAPYSAAPSVGSAGDTYYDSTTKTLYVSDGTAWNLCVGPGVITNNELALLAVGSTKIALNAVIMNKIVAAAGSPATIARVAAGAGNYTEVTGAPVIICTSSTRPASPFAGMTIFETDTYKTLQYTTATTGWQKPWGEPWGILAAPANVAGSVTGISALTDIVALGAITTVANRYVRVTARFSNIASTVANDTFTFSIQQDASNIANLRSALVPATASNGEVIIGVSQPTAASHVWKLTCTRSSGTGTGTVIDSTIFVEDIGPAANPA